MIKTAVIMAAGLGTRFGRYTDLIPKGFIPVGGKPMVVRSIETLIECGIERIIIGTGYKKEVFQELQKIYPQIECCYSELYATTNSMWTLYNCRNLIGGEDFLLLESDLVFEQRAIECLLKDEHSNIMLVADETKFQDQYFVEYNEQGNLMNCSVDRNTLKVCGELVGIHKISKGFYEQLCRYYKAIMNEQPKLGYEYALLFLAQNGVFLYSLKIPGLRWYEIDGEEDLRYVEQNLLF